MKAFGLRLLQAGLLLAGAAAAAVLFVPGANPANAFDPLDEDVCIVAQPFPHDPASGIARLDPRPVPAEARCPVCGMYPARYPRWAAQLLFGDGAAHFFDSPVNLFVFLGDVSRYSTGHENSDVAAIFVTDAQSGEWIDAKTAHYVHGSNARGPMRDGNLPAFASRESALAFATARGGLVLTATEITPAVLRPLTHRRHHRP